jgi:hypothetical protein
VPTATPFLTVQWYLLGRVEMTWTHPWTDLFGWYIEAWETATATYLVSYTSYNTALRRYVVPPHSAGVPPMTANTFYSIRVTALSTLGHAPSRTATIQMGTKVSHTFFDGTLYSWPSHDSGILDLGTGGSNSQYYLPSMDLTHVSSAGQLPADFLPVDAIPLAVTGGVRFQAVRGSVDLGDHQASTLP